MFRAIVSADIFESFMDPIQALVDEAILELTADGMHVAAVDPANVAMVDTTLEAGAFEPWDADEGRIGVNVTTLMDVVGFADSGQLVYFEGGSTGAELQITIDEFDYSYATIDPDSVRDPPELPNLEGNLQAEYVIDADDISSAISAAGLLGDDIHVRFETSVEDNEVRFLSSGDTDDMEYTVDGPDLIEGSISADALSLYSLDYLDDVIGAIPNGEAVRVNLGDEHPVKLRYQTAEGHATAESMISPRIEAE